MILFKSFIHPFVGIFLLLWMIFRDVQTVSNEKANRPSRFLRFSFGILGAMAILSWFEISFLDFVQTRLRLFEAFSLGLVAGLVLICFVAVKVDRQQKAISRILIKIPLLFGMLFLSATNFFEFQYAIYLFWILALLGLPLIYQSTSVRHCFNLYALALGFFSLAFLIAMNPMIFLDYLHLSFSTIFAIGLIILSYCCDKIEGHEN